MSFGLAVNDSRQSQQRKNTIKMMPLKAIVPVFEDVVASLMSSSELLVVAS